jgi:molybdopterin converting factor small subunit
VTFAVFITVRFLGSLRAASKKNIIMLNFERAISLRDVMNTIVKHRPTLSRALIGPENDDPRTNVLMLVNGKDTSILDGLETVLQDGDELVIVPVVHGG